MQIVKLINFSELQLMTNTIASMNGSGKKRYEIYLSKDVQLKKWTVLLKVLIDDAVVDEMLVTQMRSNNPKTFNVLEDCLNQITASCVGVGVSGRLKLNLNETVWELKL